MEEVTEKEKEALKELIERTMEAARSVKESNIEEKPLDNPLLNAMFKTAQFSSHTSVASSLQKLWEVSRLREKVQQLAGLNKEDLLIGITLFGYNWPVIDPSHTENTASENLKTIDEKTLKKVYLQTGALPQQAEKLFAIEVRTSDG